MNKNSIGIFQRINLLGLSMALIVMTLTGDGELGWKAVFPLLSIYPGLMALTGIDFVAAVVSPASKRNQRGKVRTRAAVSA